MNVLASCSGTRLRGLLVLAVFISMFGPTARPTWPQEPASVPFTRLTEGLVLERQAALGETHRYSIELRAGQYLRLLVEQRGADVSETVTGPDGGVLLETDMPCGSIGPDPVAFIAPADGVYELALKVLAVLPRGRYEIRVEALGEPTRVDRSRIKAIRAAVEAHQLSSKDPAAAVERFREAASAWRELGDRRLELWMEHQIGLLLGEHLGRLAEALEVTAHALAMAVDLGEEWAEAQLRLGLGGSLRALGRLDEGKEQFERALALHRAAGREVSAARALLNLGIFTSMAGEPQEGLDYLFEALRIFQAAGSTRNEAVTRSYIAKAFLRLRDPDLALEQCRLALPAFVEEPAVRGRCSTYMGSAHFQLGDFARARQAHSEALSILKTVPSPLLAVEAYVGLGDVQAAEGELGAARQAFESALAQAGDHTLRQGWVRCKLGEVELRLGNARAARMTFEAALALAPRAGAIVEECAEDGLGRMERDTGDLAAARTHAERALSISESVRGRLLSDQTRSALLAAQQSQYELLIDVLMRQHEQEPSRGHDVAAFETGERARARSLLALLAEGGVDVRRGVDPALLDEERSLRRRLNATANEEAQARDAGRKEQADSLVREMEAQTAGLVEIEARMRRVSPGYAALTQPQPLTLPEIRAQVLDPDTQLLQYALGEPRSYLWVASATSLQSFALAPGPEIERAARRAHELVSAPRGMVGTSGQRGEPEAAMFELSRLLLAPAVGALRAKRLLVVAPGALQYVPFASLPWPGSETVLLSTFEIVSAPSASVIATVRREARLRPPAAKVAAIFADPVFEPSDPRVALARGKGLLTAVPAAPRAAGPAAPVEQALRGLRDIRGGGLGRLPFSRREAEVIASLTPTGRTLTATGFDASREAATSPRLGEYRIVHFATHAVLNTRRPELSGVVLSLVDRAGRSQDGFLRLHDVYNLALGANLVVLSGCQTALGKDLRGEGLLGLTRGFMYAGAPAVLASLWQVDDESTAELMQRFYRAMLKDGRRPAEALRAAQLEMMANPRWAAPFYWAGFVLQGDWR
jgi:CHAT domain-containing protein/tetratricopeptide (TPR) repeat protein